MIPNRVIASASLMPLALLTPLTAAVAQEAAPSAKQVRQVFDVLYGDLCTGDLMTDGKTEPEIYQTTFNYGDEDYDPRPYTLYRFHCYYGAYNEAAAYFGVDDYGEVKQIQFAVPAIDVVYENDYYEDPVEAINVVGFTTYDLIINSDVDPDTLTISSWSKWRGIGDASSVGEWVFHEGSFVLTTYDVDASYDGAINPIRIYGDGEPDYGE